MTDYGFKNRQYLSISEVSRNRSDWLAEAPLELGNDKNKTTVFVIGNSHASAYAPLLQIVHEKMGMNTRIINMGQCVIGQVIAAAPVTTEYTKEKDRVVRLLDTESKPGDIVLLASLRLQRFVDQWGRLEPQPEEIIFGSRGKRERREGLREIKKLVPELERRGLSIVIDAPKPVLTIPPFRCVDWYTIKNPVCTGGRRVKREVIERLRSPAMVQLDWLDKRYSNVDIWDPLDRLCNEEYCEADLKGRPLFFDGDHLSNYGSRLLAEDFMVGIKKQ